MTETVLKGFEEFFENNLTKKRFNFVNYGMTMYYCNSVRLK